MFWERIEYCKDNCLNIDIFEYCKGLFLIIFYR